MTFVKKVLYWLTIIPPLVDLISGTVKGIVSLVNNTTVCDYDNDIKEFINANR